jgi:methionyl-tRNA formyltransferase
VRIIYAGTPEFAVPPLAALIGAGHDLCAVYTQPDRPAGRGQRLTASPVKQLAVAHGLAVRQPKTLKDAEAQRELAALAADVMVVAAYGLILPQPVLDAPRQGCINIHASLLPRWRGAAPIHRAILAGDVETGITIMQMEAGLDTGPMLLKLRCAIEPTDTAASLHDRLSTSGAEAILAALARLEQGTLQPEAQDDGLATYAKKIEKAEAELDWSQPAVQLDRQVRAFNPWPVAQTRFDGQVLRVWRAQPLAEIVEARPGTVTRVGNVGVDVATGAGLLRLTEVQLSGKKPVDAAAFAHAHTLSGAVLG